MRIGLILWGFILVLFSGLLALEALSIAVENAWTLVWPLLLIVVGISILYSTLISWRNAQLSTHPRLESIPLESATTARLRLEHGHGRVQITPGTDPGILLSGTFGGGLRYRSQQTGGVLNIEMQPEVKRVVALPWGGGEVLDWTFHLNNEIPLILDIETGPAADVIDLSGLQVTDLRIKTSLHPCQIILPVPEGVLRGAIESGAGGIILVIPAAASARIRTEGGLTGIQINETRFPRVGAYHQSEDYDTARHRLDLEIEIGMASLTID